METEVMDKKSVFEVIDKHIGYHNGMIEDYKNHLMIAREMYGDDSNKLEVFYSGINDSSCAIAALNMLKLELNGERYY